MSEKAEKLYFSDEVNDRVLLILCPFTKHLLTISLSVEICSLGEYT